jgi:transposase
LGEGGFFVLAASNGMSKPLVPDELREIIEPLLPEEPPKPKGGRPRVPDRARLTGIVFVLKTGLPWEDLPQELGCGSGMGHDLLAAAARLAGRRGPGAAAPGAAGPPRRRRPDRLGAGLPGFGQRPGKKGGRHTGPDPTNRGKPGPTRHGVVDRAGAPLAVCLTGANRHGSTVFEALIDAIPPIRRPSGQRRKRPTKLHAAKAYDCPRRRRAPSRRRIKVRIARTGIDPSDRLGRHRWVVERTPAWLGPSRRLALRSERRPDIHDAFLSLGCSLICCTALTRYC